MKRGESTFFFDDEARSLSVEPEAVGDIKWLLRAPSLPIYCIIILTFVLCGFAAGAEETTDAWKGWTPPQQWNQGIHWMDPGGWKIIDVTEKGLLPNDPHSDASVAVKAILAETTGRRVLYFPPGDYWFRSGCLLETGDVILRGAGAGKTRFLEDTESQATLGFAGQIGNDVITLTGNMPKRGDEWLTVESAEEIEIGDFIKLYQTNPHIVGEYGSLSGECWSQIVQVVDKRKNRLMTDMKIGLDYTESQHPRIVKMEMVRNVGLEDFYIEKLQDNDDFSLFFFGVFNGYMRGIHSRYTSKAHFKVRESRRVIVRECQAEYSWDYGIRGHGYGVVFSDNATECYALNNQLGSLRHPYHIQRGANHCVFAYNYSYKGEAPGRKGPTDNRLHGGWTNNNLFEGNVFHQWMADPVNGVNGPFNCFFGSSRISVRVLFG